MDKVLQIIAGVFAAFFTLMALRWVFDPSGAAEAIQMTLLDGAARSSQIGDIGAMFFAMAGFSAYGVWKKRAEFLFAASFVIGAAAVLRIIASLVHGAPLLVEVIIFELVVGTIWAAHARKLSA